MYTTSVTTQHLYKTKDSSWELSERIKKYLTKTFKDHKQTSVSCDHRGIIITTLNVSIPTDTLDFINDQIPTWIQEIEENNKQKQKEDINEIKTFLKTYNLLTIRPDYSHKEEIAELIDVMSGFLSDLRESIKTDTPNTCRIGDLQAYTQLINCIGYKKYKEAYKIYCSLDTSEREMIPDSIHELFES